MFSFQTQHVLPFVCCCRKPLPHRLWSHPGQLQEFHGNQQGVGSLCAHARLPVRHGNVREEKQPQLPEISGAKKQTKHLKNLYSNVLSTNLTSVMCRASFYLVGRVCEGLPRPQAPHQPAHRPLLHDAHDWSVHKCFLMLILIINVELGLRSVQRLALHGCGFESGPGTL